jgi:hypothetical protein
MHHTIEEIKFFLSQSKERRIRYGVPCRWDHYRTGDDESYEDADKKGEYREE